MPEQTNRTHTDDCGRTGSASMASCKLDCECWCHLPPAKVDELVAIQSELRERIQPRLRTAGAPRTSAKFRELMKSLEGAIRHARLQEGRTTRADHSTA